MARDYNRNNRQNENENYNDVTNRIKSLNQLNIFKTLINLSRTSLRYIIWCNNLCNKSVIS